MTGMNEAKKKILLVDDDEDFVMMNEAVLTNLGYEVESANTAREGLEKVKAFQPDMIILDLMMEHYDSGFTFSYQVKSDPETKHIPILMVTSVRRETNIPFDASTGEEKEWIKVDELIEKPISPEDIASKVEQFLAAAR
jgi:CheY-like chemotaxis protein